MQRDPLVCPCPTCTREREHNRRYRGEPAPPPTRRPLTEYEAYQRYMQSQEPMKLPDRYEGVTFTLTPLQENPMKLFVVTIVGKNADGKEVIVIDRETTEAESATLAVVKCCIKNAAKFADVEPTGFSAPQNQIVTS